jgi:hypothetical protein
MVLRIWTNFVMICFRLPATIVGVLAVTLVLSESGLAQSGPSSCNEVFPNAIDNLGVAVGVSTTQAQLDYIGASSSRPAILYPQCGVCSLIGESWGTAPVAGGYYYQVIGGTVQCSSNQQGVCGGAEGTYTVAECVTGLCPAGQIPNGGSCQQPCQKGEVLSGTGVCVPVDPYKQPPCGAGNPIVLASGNKFAHEVDIAAANSRPSTLRFERYFNGTLGHVGGPLLSPKWTHSYSHRLLLVDSATLYASRPNGQMFMATSPGAPTAAGLQLWIVDSDVSDQIY